MPYRDRGPVVAGVRSFAAPSFRPTPEDQWRRSRATKEAADSDVPPTSPHRAWERGRAFLARQALQALPYVTAVQG
jgi:hypothetical protein